MAQSVPGDCSKTSSRFGINRATKKSGIEVSLDWRIKKNRLSKSGYSFANENNNQSLTDDDEISFLPAVTHNIVSA